jgi:hypothetical protein
MEMVCALPAETNPKCSLCETVTNEDLNKRKVFTIPVVIYDPKCELFIFGGITFFLKT